MAERPFHIIAERLAGPFWPKVRDPFSNLDQIGFLIARIKRKRPFIGRNGLSKERGKLAMSPISTFEMALASALAANPGGQLNDAETVAQLDLDYQAAVKRNDVDAMDRILHPDFVLILGDGRVVTRRELLDSARWREIEYMIQDEDPGTQTVRLWQDTAVVTARLWIKGRKAGKEFERRLWFSDTYVRTPAGWRYAFAQASLPLANEPSPGQER